MSYDQVLTQSWEHFCDELKAAGNLVLRTEVPDCDRTKAEGVRYLTRLLRAGLERSIEFSDPNYPVFYALSHETIKIGSDNPDNVYRNVFVDPQHKYRISGRIGNARMLAFASKADGYSADGSMAATGELAISDMSVEEDGTFELIASVKKVPGNWLPLTEESSMILVRETHGPRENRRNAEITIEAIDIDREPAALSVSQLASALRQASKFVDVTSELFADWMKTFQDTRNDWTIVDQQQWQMIGGDSNIFYLWGYWQLNTDEALVIRVVPPTCDYWNFQVNNYWDESLDYRYFRIHQNCDTVTYDDDGGVTIVLAHERCEHPNYTVTTGLNYGAIMWRWVGAKNFPIPTCTKIRLSQLYNYL